MSISGPKDVTVAPPARLEKAGRIIHPVSLHELEADEIRELAALWREFAVSHVAEHAHWHHAHDGHPVRVHDGEAFMWFHAMLLAQFMDFVAKRAPALARRLHHFPPTWDPLRPVPAEFFFEGMRDSAKGPHGTHWVIPPYLHLHGDGAHPHAHPYVLPSPDGLSSHSVASLNDVRSVDELGQLLLVSGVHFAGHDGFGGAMNDVERDFALPAFLLVHGRLEAMRVEWLTTNAGHQAALHHPPYGWTRPLGDELHTHPPVPATATVWRPK